MLTKIMPIPFHSRRPSLNADDISGLESKLSVRFPKEYRDFLSAYNVAIPAPNQFTGSNITAPVDSFFGVSDSANDDLFEQNHKVYAGRLPDAFLAIARAAGGNLICLKPSSGAIYFWDHENEAEDGEDPSFENVTKLAGSLTDFLEALQPRSVEPAKDAKVISVQLKPAFAEKFKKYM